MAPLLPARLRRGALAPRLPLQVGARRAGASSGARCPRGRLARHPGAAGAGAGDSAGPGGVPRS
eukprot:11413446-Alexandrium_andersonii.AAC.1